jgi:hypothetical protein
VSSFPLTPSTMPNSQLTTAVTPHNSTNLYATHTHRLHYHYRLWWKQTYDPDPAISEYLQASERKARQDRLDALRERERIRALEEERERERLLVKQHKEGQ